MNMKTFLGCLALVGALARRPAPCGPSSFCSPVPVDEGDPKALGYEYPALITAYRGISRAANSIPSCWCAPARQRLRPVQRGRYLGVQVTTGLMGLVRERRERDRRRARPRVPGTSAAALATEMGVGKSTIEQVAREAQRSINRGTDPQAAIRAAKTKFLGTVTAFSRDAEREGRRPGPRAGHVRRLRSDRHRPRAAKLRSIQGGEQRGWLASHPGLDERVEASAFVHAERGVPRAPRPRACVPAAWPS
jgi:hypothetical protein